MLSTSQIPNSTQIYKAKHLLENVKHTKLVPSPDFPTKKYIYKNIKRINRVTYKTRNFITNI